MFVCSYDLPISVGDCQKAKAHATEGNGSSVCMAAAIRAFKADPYRSHVSAAALMGGYGAGGKRRA